MRESVNEVPEVRMKNLLVLLSLAFVYFSVAGETEPKPKAPCPEKNYCYCSYEPFGNYWYIMLRNPTYENSITWWRLGDGAYNYNAAWKNCEARRPVDPHCTSR